MNSRQATASRVAKRFMKRTHCRRLTTHSTAITIMGNTKWVM